MLSGHREARAPASFEVQPDRLDHHDDRHGAVEAAKRLLANGDMQSGFERLVREGHPELTVESMVCEPYWERLFTDRERVSGPLAFSSKPRACEPYRRWSAVGHVEASVTGLGTLGQTGALRTRADGHRPARRAAPWTAEEKVDFVAPVLEDVAESIAVALPMRSRPTPIRWPRSTIVLASSRGGRPPPMRGRSSCTGTTRRRSAFTRLADRLRIPTPSNGTMRPEPSSTGGSPANLAIRSMLTRKSPMGKGGKPHRADAPRRPRLHGPDWHQSAPASTEPRAVRSTVKSDRCDSRGGPHPVAGYAVGQLARRRAHDAASAVRRSGTPRLGPQASTGDGGDRQLPVVRLPSSN